MVFLKSFSEDLFLAISFFDTFYKEFRLYLPNLWKFIHAKTNQLKEVFRLIDSFCYEAFKKYPTLKKDSTKTETEKERGIH